MEELNEKPSIKIPVLYRFRPILIFVMLVLVIIISVSIAWLAHIKSIHYLPQVKIDKSKIFGTVNKQMFRDLSNPEFIPPNQIDFLLPEDEIFTWKIDKQIYAIPKSILSMRHIINFDQKNIHEAITYCLLSDTGLVFEKLPNQSLGINGQLYLGNLIMFDKNTDETYLQLSGQELSGKKSLKYLGNLERTTWKSVKNNKNILVLTISKDDPTIEVYTKFLQSRKNAESGILSVRVMQPLNDRLPPLQFGLGTTIFGKYIFVKHLPPKFLYKYIPSTQVNWYTWSANHPDTIIL